MSLKVFIRKVNGDIVRVKFQTHKPSRDDFKIILINNDILRESDFDHFQFTIGTKQLKLDHDLSFYITSKNLLIQFSTVNIIALPGTFGRRMMLFPFRRTADILDKSKQNLEKIVQSAVRKIPTISYQNCSICEENEPCIKICCHYICYSQFLANFNSNNFQYKCYYCKTLIANEEIFPDTRVEMTLKAHKELGELLNHIDISVCTCGCIQRNLTLKSQHNCRVCNKSFCFFCCKTWTPEMADQLYTCTKNCRFDNLFDYELVTFSYDQALKIPNARICPQCFNIGAYDEKCKYHTCPKCQLEFCFLCLKSKDDCTRIYGKSYKQICVEPKPQTIAMFPILFDRSLFL
eukprot:c18220_g1_i1.p1 GENE.c18220_g1_i1~~c18220_g1_i1.p1  ORF type:complete len:355 (+),score=38.22 c18220_g1_i1:24-1067(+)